jgi:hypothetical protein
MKALRSFAETVGLVALLVLPLGCTGTSDFPLDDYSALVLNSLSEDITLIGKDHPPTIVQSAVLVGTAPNEMLVQGSQVFVLNSRSNSLQVFELPDWKIVREHSLGDGCNPYWMDWTQAGQLVVTCNLTDTLLLVDPQRAMSENPVLKQLALPSGQSLKPFLSEKPSFARPQGVAVLGQRAYVTLTNLGADYSPAGPGLVAVVDLPGFVTEKIIELPNTNAASIYRAPDKKELYVACMGALFGEGSGAGTIEVLDVAMGTATRSIPVGGAPGRLWVQADGSGWAGDQLEGQALRFLSNGEVLPPVVLCPSDIANSVYNFISDIATDGKEHAYAACFATDEVKRFRLDDPNAVDSFTVGDGPQALWVVQQ